MIIIEMLCLCLRYGRNAKNDADEDDGPSYKPIIITEGHIEASQ